MHTHSPKRAESVERGQVHSSGGGVRSPGVKRSSLTSASFSTRSAAFCSCPPPGYQPVTQGMRGAREPHLPGASPLP